MGTGHDHGPDRALTATGRHRGRLGTVLAITTGIAVAEIGGALASGSLVLLADAAHVAADGAGVGLSLLAAYVAARPAADRWTFGYARAEILAATVGALLEVAADARGSIAVICTGLVVAATGFTRADPIASRAVALLILPRAWRR